MAMDNDDPAAATTPAVVGPEISKAASARFEGLHAGEPDQFEHPLIAVRIRMPRLPVHENRYIGEELSAASQLIPSLAMIRDLHEPCVSSPPAPAGEQQPMAGRYCGYRRSARALCISLDVAITAAPARCPAAELQDRSA